MKSIRLVLPDTAEGRRVLGRLRLAFERQLVFAVGTSVTSGRPGQTTWNGIHHKTHQSGGWGCAGGGLRLRSHPHPACARAPPPRASMLVRTATLQGNPLGHGASAVPRLAQAVGMGIQMTRTCNACKRSSLQGAWYETASEKRLGCHHDTVALLCAVALRRLWL